MAEGLIPPEANQILYSPQTVSSELTTQMYPTERERPQVDQLPRKYLLSFFLLMFILKIQRSTIKTGSAVACISAQADLSFCYQAKDLNTFSHITVQFDTCLVQCGVL